MLNKDIVSERTTVFIQNISPAGGNCLLHTTNMKPYLSNKYWTSYEGRPVRRGINDAFWFSRVFTRFNAQGCLFFVPVGGCLLLAIAIRLKALLLRLVFLPSVAEKDVVGDFVRNRTRLKLKPFTPIPSTCYTRSQSKLAYSHSSNLPHALIGWRSFKPQRPADFPRRRPVVHLSHISNTLWRLVHIFTKITAARGLITRAVIHKTMSKTIVIKCGAK